jgi:hypothetical protein
MSRNVLAYLRFLSRTSRTLPSESRSSSPSSVSDSGAVAEREVARDGRLIGSYLELPRVDSVGERRGTLALSTNDGATLTVDVTELTLTFAPALLVGGQISWEEVNGYIDDACDEWGDQVDAEAALTLALN